MLGRITPLARSSCRASLAAARSMATAADTHAFPIRTPLKYHLLEDAGVTTSTITKEELLAWFREMYTIRRMEIACDTEYKARNIRGFCHLYDGQEAIAMGMQAALSKDDDVISSYRCHALQYIRGGNVKSIVGELFGFGLGSSKGKGGSMHFYSKKNRFWGGSGIVGAQVPVGVGLGFANMYRAKKQWPVNVSVAMYGDGAANQGQIYEVANMAKLWHIPTIFLCENNQYGMGTSTARSSANNEYYKQGGVATPGIQCDGMDALAVFEAFKLARAHASSGKGPIFLEAKTYRYHGHSMSDPGITYRDRDEVASVRASRDCIEQVKARLVEAGWATADDLKAVEKDVRAAVTAQVDEARKGTVPPPASLYDDIFLAEVPAYIRGAEHPASIRNGVVGAPAPTA